MYMQTLVFQGVKGGRGDGEMEERKGGREGEREREKEKPGTP